MAVGATEGEARTSDTENVLRINEENDAWGDKGDNEMQVIDYIELFRFY